MGSGVVGGQTTVVIPGNDLSLENQNGTDWNFSSPGTFSRLLQSHSHEVEVLGSGHSTLPDRQTIS